MRAADLPDHFKGMSVYDDYCARFRTGFSTPSLGDQRYQFLSSSPVPEDVLNLQGEARRKDVFLLAGAVHALIFGGLPQGEPPEWSDGIDPDGAFAKLHPWFSRALDIDPAHRFGDAGEMLGAFNLAIEASDQTKALIEGIERFRNMPSQRQVFKAYPESELLREDDRVVIWRSDSGDRPRLVKLWKSEAIGDLAKERSRILAFLERAKDLMDSPAQGVPRIRGVHWTGDAIVLVQDFVLGVTLADEVEGGAKTLRTEVPYFLSKLMEIVSSLHDRGLAPRGFETGIF